MATFFPFSPGSASAKNGSISPSSMVSTPIEGDPKATTS